MSEKKAGRPRLSDESQRKVKNVTLSFTQDEYDELKRMQELFNQATLTATILMFMKRGQEAVREEFVRQRWFYLCLFDP